MLTASPKPQRGLQAVEKEHIATTKGEEDDDGEAEEIEQALAPPLG